MALNNLLSRRDTVLLSNGQVNAGGLVDIFEPNTAVRIATYKDSDLTQQNTNPVVLDAAGKGSIWFAPNADMDIRSAPTPSIPLGTIYVSEQSVNPDALGGGSASGLVPNGSFEIDTDANNEPDGWTRTDETGSTNFLDTLNSTDGLQSMRFESTGSGGGNIVTQDFFVVNDIDDLSVQFDLFSSVANVRNIVRVEWFDVSQVSISNTDVYDDSATNPVVFTSQQTTATPPAGARFAKLRIIGCDPSVATVGSTNYDRVNVFYPLVVANTFATLLVTSPVNPDLVGIGNSMNVGAVNPAVSPHLAFGPSVIQAKATATTTAQLNIGSLGGSVRIGAQSGTGSVLIYRDALIKLDLTNSQELRYRGSGVADPATGGTQQSRVSFQNESGVETSEFGHGGFIASTILRVTNRVQSAQIDIVGTTAALAEIVMASFVPEVNVLFPGTDVRLDNPANTLAQFRAINTSGGIDLRVEAGGGGRISQLTAAGAFEKTWLQFTRDGIIEGFNNNVSVFRSTTAALGGLEANNTLTGAGYERVLTASDAIVGGVLGGVLLANQDVGTSITLVDVNQLSAALQPSASYILEATLVFEGNGATANGFRWGLDFNGQLANLDTLFGGSFSWQQSGLIESIIDAAGGVSQVKTTFDAAGVREVVKISVGIVTQSDYVVDTPVDVQFAQGTSNATNTTISEGSSLKVTRVA